MPFQPITPTWFALNACNDLSPTGLVDSRTGAAYFAGGLNLGDFFDLTESEANALSYVPAAGTSVQLHAGRYRRVQVDSGATASNVKVGTVGLMGAGQQPQLNRVTSYDKGIVAAHVVIFLNTVTPGNFCFVQELGVASVLMGSTLQKATPVTGDIIVSTTLGVGQDTTAQTVDIATLGIALTAPSPNTLGLVLLDRPTIQG